MFHLFDNVYLEHEKWYSSQYNHLILSINELKHPASRQTPYDLITIPPLEKMLADHFGGTEEGFWAKMVDTPKDEKFIIFLDEELLFKFKVCYWKSVLKAPADQNLFQLYQLDFLDAKLKRYLYVGSGIKTQSDWELKNALTYEEFSEKVKSIEPSDILSSLEKSRVGFELLLANHFLNDKYKTAFQERLKELSWRAWFDEVEILRSDIINSFYDIRRIFPDASFSFSDTNLVEHFIMSEPRLRWILDPEFGSRNSEYVRKNYPKEIFIELSKKVLNYVDGKDESTDLEDSLPTEYVFEDRYEDLLKKNINKKFGCLFVNDQLKSKANQLLPLLVYEKVRENRISELAFLELR